ncbi:MAG TPA: hypothetical protein VJX73_11020 [Terracidiphilus sp.]|nr:hypothetical protein [Terracidiphilus sp.]
MRFRIALCCVTAGFVIGLVAQVSQAQSPQSVAVVQGTLTAPGSAPFHLKAEITDDGDSSPMATMEMSWLDPNHWRREIRSEEFSQTMVVNGEKVFEQDSTEYFPLGLWSITTAMVDPAPILAKLGPADQIRTKANGLSSESGVSCFDASHRYCMSGPWGLEEFVGGAGHSIEFEEYRPFHGKRIARRLVYLVSAGDFMTARVMELQDLTQPSDDLFAVEHPTDPSNRVRVVTLDQAALMDLVTEKSAIIWPQVLDGKVTGKGSFYISIDTAGKIREIHPVRTDNERTNDPAIRQMMRWKFKPPVVDGIPAQVEGILTFDLNTREYGPKEVLADAEMRKMATSTAELDVPPGTVPPGSVKKVWVAVDADGYVIEWIAGDGPGGLSTQIVDAMKHWSFKPIYIDGKPMPYRGEIDFHVN